MNNVDDKSYHKGPEVIVLYCHVRRSSVLCSNSVIDCSLTYVWIYLAQFFTGSKNILV